MKRIILFAVALFTFMNVFGQSQISLFNQHDYNSGSYPTAEKSGKALGPTILFDDFSNASNWVFQNTAMGTANWKIGTVTDPEASQLSSYLGGLSMWNPNPQSSNPVAYFNAIQYLLNPPATFPTTINVTLTMANSIDLSAYPAVGIQWYQNYRAYNYDKLYLEYSIDGGSNWTIAGGGELFASVIGNNWGPTMQNINLTSMIGSQTNVKIRFRWECNCTSTNHGLCAGYGWMIDNFLIYSYQNNDLSVDNVLPVFYGVGYYSQLPVNQRMKISQFKAAVYNNGAVAQTNVDYNVKIFPQGSVLSEFTHSSAIIKPSIDSWIKDTLLSDSSFFPPRIIQNHYIIGTVQQSELDDDISDNVDTLLFAVTDSVFARDRSIFNDRVGPTMISGNADGDMIASMYYLPNQDTVSSISVFIHPTSNVGATISGVILYYSGAYTIQISTPNYVIQSSDLGHWVTLSFKSNYDGFSEILTPATKYYAAIKFNWKTVQPLTTDHSPFIATENDSPISYNERKAITKLIRGTVSYTLASINYPLPLIRMNMKSQCRVKETHVITNVSTTGATDGAINLTMSGGVLPYSFQWSNGAVTEDLTALPTGVYSVVVSDSIGCKTSVAFGILATCTMQLSATVTDPSGANNDGSITLNIQNGTAPFQFSWSNGSHTQNLTSLVPGNYTVTVIDSNLCYKTDVWTIHTSGIDDQEQENSVKIFPNPTSGELNFINVSAENVGIYNLLGQEVLYFEKPKNKIDISSLSKGVYILKIVSGSGIFNQKLYLSKE